MVELLAIFFNLRQQSRLKSILTTDKSIRRVNHEE